MRDNIVHHQMHTLDSPSVITFSTERPRMLVSWSFIAQNAPTESCRCTTRIPWYHQNPAYTHRILFALTAWVQSKRVYALVGSVNHLEWMEWHYNSWSQSNRRGSPWCFKAILYLVSFYQQLQIRSCLNPLTCMQQRGSLHSMRWSFVTSGGKVKSSCIKFLWHVCNQVIKFLVHYIHIKPN